MMDLRYLLLIILALEILCVANGDNLVFQVERRKTTLSGIKHHDHHRRGRFLSSVDFNLGGNGLPTRTGLYFTKLGLGSPKKDYYVQVDTGSDILWVNCVECSRCPTKSQIGMDLTLYDPKGSHTSELISCDHEFCSSTYDGPIPGCKAETPCPYSITYGDGSATTGYYVRDYLTFDRINGNLHTAPQNSSIIFGCGAVQSGTLGASSEEALDGIIGFGQENSSVLSQLAASRKVKKIFSHCLDNIRGGGIFAIGELVEPKVRTTPLVPNMAHYNVVLKNIEVDGDVLQLPSDIFDSGNGKGTVIDSGTTLAYLPVIVYDQLIPKIFARQPELKLARIEEQFKCFPYAGNVDGGFPVVKLHFEGSLSLTVYPHDYLFQYKAGVRCIGWQKSVTQTKDGKDMTLLGDLVLSNKLVLYDLENMAIGWTEYNCSSSIKVKDATTGIVHTVGAHNISSASTFLIGRILSFFLLLIAMLNCFYN
ncbi:putative nepenthesin [Medicago truncatula]|uniref:Eukaryotic aspartyl protease family protein n=1 Tax=Medicago truncatula TaxID=3880 RepID=A0A072VMV4_MEDTR|nr:aspartic proteinase 36 isoform X2 [Medicago truncatula]KEH42941.1 eukaryotic aspartyl protease family protein [Medicago truncatula]RHN80539.1 putative nepenthesin [Medicago truncatula]